jgi:hypothetical protein
MSQAADAAQVLAGAAGQLAVQTAGVGRAAAPGELPASVARQARALAGYAQQLAQAAPGQQGRPGQAAPAQPSQPAARRAHAPQAAGRQAAVPAQAGQTAGGQVPGARARQVQGQPAPAPRAGGATAPFRQQASSASSPQPAAGWAAQSVPDSGREPSNAAGTPAQITRVEAQDLLLAALMRDSGLAREIVSSLPPSAFEDGPRRELYTMIGEFVAQRRPVDPLLVAWTADQRTSAGPDGVREGWLSPDYIRGIALLPPVPVHPAWLGQMLLSGTTAAPAPAETERANSPTETATTTPEPRQEPARTAETAPGATPDSSQAAGTKAAAGPAPRPVRPTSARPSAPPRGSRTEATPAPGTTPGLGLIEAPPPDPAQDGGSRRVW